MAKFIGGWDYAAKRAKLMAMKNKVDTMRRLRAKGMTLAQIGEQFGVSREYVHQLVGRMVEGSSDE